jgi:two-component system response regulator HydG
VRELRNLIERLVILGTTELIEPHHLPGQFVGRSEGPLPAAQIMSKPGTLASIERRYILSVLDQVKGNKSEAAKILGITRQTLRKKLAETPAD